MNENGTKRYFGGKRGVMTVRTSAIDDSIGRGEHRNGITGDHIVISAARPVIIATPSLIRIGASTGANGNAHDRLALASVMASVMASHEDNDSSDERQRVGHDDVINADLFTSGLNEYRSILARAAAQRSSESSKNSAIITGDNDVDGPYGPVSMVIIMRDSKDADGKPAPTLSDSLIAAGGAMLSLLALLSSSCPIAINDAKSDISGRGDAAPPDSHDYQEWLAAWSRGRIRKVVKHAKRGKYEAVKKALRGAGVPYVAMVSGDAESIVLPPIPESLQAEEWFKPVHKLQVHGYHVKDEEQWSGDDGKDDGKNQTGADDEEPSGEPRVIAEGDGAVLVRVSDELSMSPGKMIAQCLHAVQLSVGQLAGDAYRGWSSTGFKTVYALMPPSTLGDVIIHDAGFTEIPAGSFTASASFYAPGCSHYRVVSTTQLPPAGDDWVDAGAVNSVDSVDNDADDGDNDGDNVDSPGDSSGDSPGCTAAVSSARDSVSDVDSVSVGDAGDAAPGGIDDNDAQ